MTKDSETKVEEILEKKKAEEETTEEEVGRREIHPLESNIIFREEILVHLNRIATAVEVLATQNEKPVKQEDTD